jgi:hypothetical protein
MLSLPKSSLQGMATGTPLLLVFAVSLVTSGFVLSANANERKTAIITFDAPGAVNGTSALAINPGDPSQDSTLTQTLFLTASCVPPTAPSRRSILQSAVPWLMFHRSQAQPSARTGRLREPTSTPAWWDTVSCVLPTARSRRSTLQVPC